MWNLKTIQMKAHAKEKQIHRYGNKPIVIKMREVWGGTNWGCSINIYILLSIINQYCIPQLKKKKKIDE